MFKEFLLCSLIHGSDPATTFKMKYEMRTTNLHPQPHGNSVDNKNSSKITSLFIAYQLSSYYRITKWNDWYVNDFLLRRMNTLYAVIIHLHISLIFRTVLLIFLQIGDINVIVAKFVSMGSYDRVCILTGSVK